MAIEKCERSICSTLITEWKCYIFLMEDGWNSDTAANDIIAPHSLNALNTHH